MPPVLLYERPQSAQVCLRVARVVKVATPGRVDAHRGEQTILWSEGTESNVWNCVEMMSDQTKRENGIIWSVKSGNIIEVTCLSRRR